MRKKSREKQRNSSNRNPRLEKQKRMKKYRIIKFILKLLIFMALLTGLIVYGFTSPIFNITEIKILGNEKFEEEEYLNLSNLNIGDNIFNFRKSTVISNIKNNAYVESVKIKRKLPTKVEITIEERIATYLISLDENEFAYINNQGYILEKSQEKLPLTIIKGISTEIEKIVEGNRLENEDLEKLQNVIQIKDSMKNIEITKELSQIDITNKFNYILTFEKEGVPGTIYLNQEQVYFSPK